MSNTRRTIDINLLLRNLSDLSKLEDTLGGTADYAERLEKALKRVDRQIGDIARARRDFDSRIKSATQTADGKGGWTSGQLASELRTGGPMTNIINSSIQGRIKQFDAEANQQFAKMTNTFTRGISNFVKAVENQAVLSLANTRQSKASQDLPTLKQQMAAQEYRVANARMYADQKGTKTAQREYEREQNALARLQSAHDKINQELKETKFIDDQRIQANRKLKVQMDDQIQSLERLVRIQKEWQKLRDMGDRDFQKVRDKQYTQGLRDKQRRSDDPENQRLLRDARARNIYQSIQDLNDPGLANLKDRLAYGEEMVKSQRRLRFSKDDGLQEVNNERKIVELQNKSKLLDDESYQSAQKEVQIKGKMLNMATELAARELESYRTLERRIDLMKAANRLAMGRDPEMLGIKDEQARDNKLNTIRRSMSYMDDTGVSSAEKELETKRRIIKTDERIADLANKITLAEQRGDRMEETKLKVKRGELDVERALLRNRGQITEEVERANMRLRAYEKTQSSVLASVKEERKERSRMDSRDQSIKNNYEKANDKEWIESMAAINRAQNRHKLFSDGGAFLFEIQAALLSNYMIMNQVFNLFQFGTTFVMELDQAMTQLQAITATTSTEMEGLEQTLIKVSEKTKFTAVEVAQAATVMGQAGFSTRQIEDSIEAVTMFASAVGTDLQKAVDIATSTLSVFNMQASETKYVADILTSAINNSKLTVDKLTLGLQYSGNVAAQSGANFEELTTVIAAFANAGIRAGSTIGTGLRQLLVAFNKPTDKLKAQLTSVGLTMADVDVRSNGLIGVLKNLREAGFSAGNAFESLEVRAASAFMAIGGQLDTIDNMQRAIISSNAAAEANETQMESLTNTFAQFKSVLGTFIAYFSEPFKNALIGVTKTMVDWFQVVNENRGAISALGTAIISLGSAVITAKLVALFKGLTGIMWGVVRANTAAAASFTGAKGLGVAIARFLGPFGLILSTIAGGIGLFASLNTSVEDSADAVDKATAEFNKAQGEAERYQQTMKTIDDRIAELESRYEALKDDQQAVNLEVTEARNKFTGLNSVLDNSKVSLDNLIDSLKRLKEEYRGLTLETLEKTIKRNEDRITTNLDMARERTGPEAAQDPIRALIGGRTVNQSDVTAWENIENLEKLGYGFSTKRIETYDAMMPTMYDIQGVDNSNAPEALRAAQSVLDQARAALDQDASLETIIPLIREVTRAQNDLTGDMGLARRAERGEGMFAGFDEEGRKFVTELAQTFDTRLDNLLAPLQDAKTALEENAVIQDSKAQEQFKGTDVYARLTELESEVRRKNSEFNESYKGKNWIGMSVAEREAQLDQDRFELSEIKQELENLKAQNPEIKKWGLDNTISASLSQARGDLRGYQQSVDDMVNTTLEASIELAGAEVKRLKDSISDKTSVAGMSAIRAQMREQFVRQTQGMLQQYAQSDEMQDIAATDMDLYERMIQNFVDKRESEWDRISTGIQEDEQKILDNLRKWRDPFTQFKNEVAEAANAYQEEVNRIELETARLGLQRQAMDYGAQKGRYSDADRWEMDQKIERRRVEELPRFIEEGKRQLTEWQNALENFNNTRKDIQKTLRDLLSDQGIDIGGDVFDTTAIRSMVESAEAQNLVQFSKEEENTLNTMLDKLDKSNKTRAEHVKKMEAEKAELDRLVAEYDYKMGRNMGAPNDLASEFDTRWKMFQKSIGANNSFVSRMGDGMTTVFETINSSFANMVQGIASGTQSIGDSFRNMAMSIIESMLQIAAQEAAMGLFKMVLGSISFGSGQQVYDAPIGPTQPVTSGFHGLPGKNNGGFIRANSGKYIPTRDSVPVLARPGEFILRNSAVDLIGRDNLEALNAMGNRVTSKSSGVQMPRPEGEKKVNVYVVAPDQKPSMGPNDVIATISEDIIKGGSTKKLIKSVNMGTL